MASEKNITMRQYNGVDYDTLYPKTIAEQVDGVYSKDEVLSNSTKALYGLTDSAVPDDALAMIKTLIDNGDASANANANSRAKIASGSYIGANNNYTEIPITVGFYAKLFLIFVDNAGLQLIATPGETITQWNFTGSFTGTIYDWVNMNTSNKGAGLRFTDTQVILYDVSTTCNLCKSNIKYLWVAIG